MIVLVFFSALMSIPATFQSLRSTRNDYSCPEIAKRDLRAVPRNIGPIQDQKIIASGYSYSIDLFNKGNSNMIKGWRRELPHGIPVQEGEAPFMVQVGFSKCDTKYPYFCGGALVEDKNQQQWVITAAHCISDLGPEIPTVIDFYEIKAGSVYRNDTMNTQIRHIQVDEDHINIHPDYKVVPPNGDPFCVHNCSQNGFCRTNFTCCYCDTEEYSDIALLKIDEPFTGEDIEPLKIDNLWSYFKPDNDGDDLINKAVTIYGWGLDANNIQPNQLMKQQANVGELVHRLFVLYHPAGFGSCRGDSGGPAIYSVDGKNILVGVSSWIESALNCLDNTESNYANVVYFKDWMRSIIYGDQLKEYYSLSELGTLCKHPIENLEKCKEAATYFNAINNKLKGNGVDLPFGCVLDKVSSGSRFIYWNQNGVVSGSLDPNIRQVCHNK